MAVGPGFGMNRGGQDRDIRDRTVHHIEKGAYIMKRHKALTAIAALGVLSILGVLSVREARAQQVFQGAGPTAASIQGVVDAFRAALGEPNNGSGPARGRGSPRDQLGRRGQRPTRRHRSRRSRLPATPVDRGGQFTTPGTGLSQAPPSGGPRAAWKRSSTTRPTLNLPDLQPPRLFTPVGSRITDGFFFVPGTAAGTPADVTGFGAVFTDVDKPNGTKGGGPSTTIDYFDVSGKLLFSAASPRRRVTPACRSSASCSTTR